MTFYSVHTTPWTYMEDSNSWSFLFELLLFKFSFHVTWGKDRVRKSQAMLGDWLIPAEFALAPAVTCSAEVFKTLKKQNQAVELHFSIGAWAIFKLIFSAFQKKLENVISFGLPVCRPSTGRGGRHWPLSQCITCVPIFSPPLFFFCKRNVCDICFDRYRSRNWRTHEHKASLPSSTLGWTRTMFFAIGQRTIWPASRTEAALSEWSKKMQSVFLTVLPASLLCRFMADRASGLFSRASANSRDTMLPKSASSLQPPHFQPSPGGPLCRVSQPQMVADPSAQDLVTAKATPAEAMAWTKADSLVAEGREIMEFQQSLLNEESPFQTLCR